MLNIAPIKSTPYPTLRSCIDDCIQSVAKWQGTDSKCMYGNAWQMSFEEQQSPDQPLIERLMLPRISTESLSAYHGLRFSYIERKGPAMDKNFMLDILESRLSSGMPVLVGFDSYDCPWCVAFRRLHTSHACLAVGLDRSSNIIYLTDAYYGKELEAVDFDLLEQACHFYALFDLCDTSRSYTDWQTTLQGMLTHPTHQIQPGQVAAQLSAYADAYLEEGVTGDGTAEASSNFKIYANALPISRIRFSLFLQLLDDGAHVPALSRAAEGYRHAGEQWDLINQFIIKVMCSGNKQAARVKIHKKMCEIISLEEQLLDELVELTMIINNHY
ncbi:hypothetical protein A3844_22750 [Paenibacillus helianthi]|uniref:Butirosin biosynthesis protein H N-terminal domain-containing protein n=1 Tax=Paenibacillus helianthi TaxID=1349432 RepID=A0ABX3EKY0_9BACL|nr:hypothetical protein [Paenibacillus helianthi]OKP83277.1 hypothetical protein A3844_22750 [Paenibacillus helianthi]